MSVRVRLLGAACHVKMALSKLRTGKKKNLY